MTTERTARLATITTATALSQRALTHGPRAAWSLASSRTMIDVLGSISPHIAWTASVMSPRGAPGDSATAAARTISPPKTP